MVMNLEAKLSQMIWIMFTLLRLQILLIFQSSEGQTLREMESVMPLFVTSTLIYLRFCGVESWVEMVMMLHFH